MARRLFALLVPLAVSAAVFAGCEGENARRGLLDHEAGESPCLAEDPPAACEQSCREDDACPTGFHCAEDGTCHAQCSEATGGCPVTHRCNTAAGKCEATSGPCAGRDAPEGCGMDCARNADCPFTFDAPTVCAGSICTTECVPDTHEGCRAGESCDLGVCKPGERPPSSDDGGACAPTQVSVERVTPTVVLTVDQSGSMGDQRFPKDCPSCPLRWDAVVDALTDPADGLVTDLESQVRFGLAMYSGRYHRCPDLTTVDPALNNHASIDTTLDTTQPKSETPTGEAIDGVVDWLRGFPQVPDTGRAHWEGDPIVLVLATDGEPDTCAVPTPSDAQQLQLTRRATVDAASRAHEAGIRTFVISVGTDVANLHLQDVANAGVGQASSAPDDAPFWEADDAVALQTALRKIVGNQLSCQVELDGEIRDLAHVCEDGEVTLNGRTLPCNDPDGWRAVDARHVEILGAACEELNRGRITDLEARFACGSVFVGL